MPTPLQQLAEHRLGRSLDTYVTVRLAEGMGWRAIAADLARDIPGLVISYETLRSWYGGEKRGAA